MPEEDVIEQTEFGWAVKSETPPKRHDLFWLTPEGHIYTWEGCDVGWYRIKPPELGSVREINHG